MYHCISYNGSKRVGGGEKTEDNTYLEDAEL